MCVCVRVCVCLVPLLGLSICFPCTFLHNRLYPRYAALVDPRYANGVEKKGSPHDRGLRGCWWAMYSSENCDDEIDDEDEEGTLVGLASAAYQASQITNGGEAAGSDH
eukprot:COSAG05_NODE_1535_length_4614_cov_342.629900_4_plen_108_part_00